MFKFFLRVDTASGLAALITFLDEWSRKAAWIALWGALFLIAPACQTMSPLPPVDLTGPGWDVRTGQAVWNRVDGVELAGEVLAAYGQDGHQYVQFTKNPFPVMIFQCTPTRWELQVPADKKRYSGRGNPPQRLIFAQFLRAISGNSLSREWSWQTRQGQGWRLQHRKTGEALEGYFSQ